jgi:hypothetical protein
MQAIEGAGGASDDIGRNAGTDSRRRQPAMAEQRLDDADIGAGFEQVRGEAYQEITSKETAQGLRFEGLSFAARIRSQRHWQSLP